MRIAVISTPVFPCPPVGYSGLEFLAWQQAKGLAAKGHQVALFAPDGSHCEGAVIVPIGPPGSWNEKQAYGKYWQHLLGPNGEDAFDVIIDNSWQKWAFSLKLEGRIKAPLLAVCHAPVNTMHQSLPDPGMVSFVCISKDQASHFEALFSRECRYVYNGVDTSFYQPLNVPRTNRFLFLARFSTIKGPLLAIEACKAAGVGLDLIGDTSITNEPEYLEKCKRACDGKQIRLIGPATRSECVYWFSQAHCLLHPNFPAPKLGHPGFREPFGLAPVEAQLCGTLVIAGNFGACRETIKHGETGWIVKSMDDLIETIKIFGGEVGFRKERRERCREWASQFSIEAMVSGYEKLCQEAIQTGGW